MCFKFAKQSLKLDKMKKFFTRNKNGHAMDIRSSEFYKVEKYQTERFGKSAIPMYSMRPFNRFPCLWDRDNSPLLFA